MNALSVQGLNVTYKDFALQDISFELPQGYILGYVGQNGAGKTTTINAITHLIKSKSESVTINGISYKDDPILFKEQIGFIGDESYFPADFTARQIRSVMKEFYPTFRIQEFNEMLTKWKLPLNKKIKDYSKGMKVRLMFATVLARDTKLLILDEATNGLDPVMKEEVLDLLQNYIEDGTKSVLFSTHIMSDLEQIADYIFFIDHGKKVLFEQKDELLERYVLVKGGLDDLTPALERQMIGLKKSHVGFEGIIDSMQTVQLNQNFVLEKPAIERLVIHLIQDREEQNNGSY